MGITQIGIVAKVPAITSAGERRRRLPEFILWCGTGAWRLFHTTE